MKKLSLLILTIFTFACSPKKEGVSAVTVGSGIIGAFGTATVCPQGTNASGYIFEGSQIQYAAGDLIGSFQDRVNAFLSTTMTPLEIGTVSSQMNASTGVNFLGLIKLDANGNVIGAQSKLTIAVRDSIWMMNPTDNPILVQFVPTNPNTVISGQFNAQTKVGSIVLRDQYGEVRFDGQLDAAQNFSGLIKFSNSVSVVGSVAKSTLGNFTIPRCALLQ